MENKLYGIGQKMKSKTKTEEWLYNNGYLDPHGTTRTYPSPEGEEGVIKETVELADILDSFTLKQTKDLEYATKKVTELSIHICKMQDDIASLVSSHRSDWSWNDVVEDVKKLVEERDNLKKQTAAKNKALNDEIAIRDAMVEQLQRLYPYLLVNGNAFDFTKYVVNAAERDLDYLRTLVQELRVENAALKVGKK